MFDAEIIPRTDLTPDQLRHLGRALRFWLESEDRRKNPEGLAWTVDGTAVAALLGGEPPLSELQVRLETAAILGRVRTGAECRALLKQTRADPWHGRPSAALCAILEAFGGGPENIDAAIKAKREEERRRLARRCVRLTILAAADVVEGFTAVGADWGPAPEGDCQRVAASLRRRLPGHLVANVLIDGRNWSEFS